jgi:peptidoglycan/LPS O-acetylase OafA/YrhL
MNPTSVAGRTADYREFSSAFEGLRGYSILVVFLWHYLGPAVLPRDGSVILTLLERTFSATFFVVPVFFVISGLLISDILHETRNKEGYFRVFYSRRLLRICPAYYLTLLFVTALEALRGASIDPRFWTHFLFLQNLLPGYSDSRTTPTMNEVGHLWFVAAIVQFYLIWPLVVWLCPNRNQLLRITWCLIVLVSAIRFAAPRLHLSVADCYVSTATRADAILLGVAISLSRGSRAYKKLQAWAGLGTMIAIGAMVFVAFWVGDFWPNTYRRVAIMNPLANLAGAFLVIAVMRPKSPLSRVCNIRWARWLGNLSFAIYVFHYTYSDWFLNSLAPRLQSFMSIRESETVAASLAFILTIGLALLDRKLIEKPMRSLSARISYGRPTGRTSRAIPA